MKNRILKYILAANRPFFEEEFSSVYWCEKLFHSHEQDFNNMLLEEFLGHIPLSVKEPTLHIFEEHADAMERWVLFQSYYVNRRAIREPLKIQFFDGMMILLKTMYLMASANKRLRTALPTPEKKVEVAKKSWVDNALEELSNFTHGLQSNKSPEASEGQDDESSSS